MELPKFRISMRYAPEVQGFEVWVSYVDAFGRRNVLQPRFDQEERITESDWDLADPGKIIRPSFIVQREETFDLSQELHRYGTFKPDKKEPDMEQIEWLRKLVERSMFPPSNKPLFSKEPTND